MKSESEVVQSCPTLSDPIDCSLSGSSVHGIFPGKSTGVGCHCLLWYAEHIMLNARLNEAQVRIKIAGRNINNLRYVDDTTLMAESEEELKSLMMKVKEESEKVG